MADNDWNSGEFASAFETRQHRTEVNHVKGLLCPMLPDITQNTALFAGSQATPACPSGKSSITVVPSITKGIFSQTQQSCFTIQSLK
jgi:hypothetical protein